MKRIILYPPGCYGRFVEWSLRTISSNNNFITYPFRKDGSAHNGYKSYIETLPKKSILNVSDIQRNKIIDLDNFNLISAHYYSKKDFIQAKFDNKNLYLIILPDLKRKTLINNNRYYKVTGWIDFLSNQSGKKINKEKLSEIRKLISISSEKIIRDEIENINPSKCNHILILSIDELIDHYPTSILKILSHFKLPINKNYLKIKDIYNNWIYSQEHIYKDKLITYLSETIINRQDVNLENISLTVVDEAEILNTLSKKGFLIDYSTFPEEFPKSTIEFYRYIKDR